MKILSLLVFSVVLILLFSSQGQTKTNILDDESKNLAFCSSVFAYAANWFLLQNNEGAAKLMIFQQARASTALMANHYHDGVISGEKMSAASEEGRKVKPFLDSNPEQIHHAVDECVKFTDLSSAEKADSETTMWGQSFYEIVDSIAETGRKGIGLQ